MRRTVGLVLRHVARVRRVRGRKYRASCWCGWSITSPNRAHATDEAEMHANLGELAGGPAS